MFVAYIKQDKNNFWKIHTIYVYMKIVLQNLIHTCWDSIKLLNKWGYKIYFESKLILLHQTVLIPFEYNFENIWKYKSSEFKVLGMRFYHAWPLNHLEPTSLLALPPPTRFRSLLAESSSPLRCWPTSSSTNVSPLPFPYFARPPSLSRPKHRQQWQFAPATGTFLARPRSPSSRP